MLDDRCKKNTIEINLWKEKNENLEKELAKLQTVNKLNPLTFARNFALSKNVQNDKEVIERLTSENENYQKKINLQENEFRITNETLKTEIFNLMNNQKQLEQQLEELKKEEKPETGSSNCDDSKSKLSYQILAEKEQLSLQINEMAQNNESMREEKEAALSKLNDANERLNQLQKEYDSLLDKFSRVNGQAESRKSVIDEMKAHIDEINAKHKHEMEKLNKRLNQSMLNIQKLEEEKNGFVEKVNECKDLKSKLFNIQNLLRNCLKDCQILNELHFEARQEVKQFLVQFKNESDENSKKIKEAYDTLLNEWQEKWRTLQGLNQSNEKELNIAKQKISDEVEERKIHERKGMMIIKELKRELNSEKKRADKLQEKLEEILSEKSSSSMVMDITLNNRNNDSSSVGSWSFMSNKEQSGIECNVSQYSESDLRDVSPINSPPNQEGQTGSDTTNAILEQENSNLVSRVTKLQQEI